MNVKLFDKKQFFEKHIEKVASDSGFRVKVNHSFEKYNKF